MTPWSMLRRAWVTPPPAVGVDIAADRVSAVAFERRRGVPHAAACATAPLPAGAVVPDASAPNIVDRDAVVDALRQLWAQLPHGPGRIGLTVPDEAAQVSFVAFEKVPARAGDLDGLIAWQMRKAAPFRLEDVQLAYAPGVRQGEHGREYVVVLMRRDIVQEYEAVCAASGASAGLVDLAGMNIVNAALLLLPTTEADWLLVHVTRGAGTLAIIRGRALIVFRACAVTTAEDFSNLLHQSVMYYQDRLAGGGLERAIFVGSESGNEIDILADALGIPVERLRVGESGPALGGAPSALDAVAAPMGLILRESPPAA